MILEGKVSEDFDAEVDRLMVYVAKEGWNGESRPSKPKLTHKEAKRIMQKYKNQKKKRRTS